MNKTWVARLSVAAAVVAGSALGAGASGAQTTSSTTTSSTTTTTAPTTTTAVAACTASFNADPVPVGTEIIVTVRGFLPNEDVTATVDGTSIGTATADASGVVTESLGSVPNEAAGLQARFDFVGTQSGATCSAVLNIGPAPAPAAKAAAVHAKAAFTG